MNRDFKYKVYEVDTSVAESQQCIAMFTSKEDAILFSTILRYLSFNAGNLRDYYVTWVESKKIEFICMK